MIILLQTINEELIMYQEIITFVVIMTAVMGAFAGAGVLAWAVGLIFDKKN